MGLVADLDSGRFGVRFFVPEGFSFTEETASVARFVDQARGFGLTLGFFSHRLDLRAENEALLRRDIERHTRDLFDTCFRSGEPRDGNVKARTEDESWSPVVDVSFERVAGARALWVVHRLWYEPTKESILGHLLVPLSRGLFEIRVVPPRPPITGIRESTVLAKVMADSKGENPVAIMKRLGQGGYDDPKWDSAFPTHPLSVTRKALRFLLSDTKIEVLEPALEEAGGEDVMEHLGFAMTPPPRYLRMRDREDAGARAVYSRVSFSGTDGVSLLTVSRPDTKIGNPTGASLLRIAERITRQSVPPGVSDIQLGARVLAAGEGTCHAETYRAYTTAGQSQHSVFHWVGEADGSVALVSIGTSLCVPKEELVSDAEAVARSFRRLRVEGAAAARLGEARGTKTQKKWWQIF